MVNWDAKKDRIILMGIFKFHDIKNSKPLLDYLAAEIGGNCTAKAVSHRLSNLRNSGKMTNGNSPSSAVKKTPSTPRVLHTPASGRGRVSKTASAKKLTDDDDGDETASDDEQPVSPSVGRKRARVSKVPASYAESDADSGDEEEEFTPVVKKVKEETAEGNEGLGGSLGAGELVEAVEEV